MFIYDTERERRVSFRYKQIKRELIIIFKLQSARIELREELKTFIPRIETCGHFVFIGTRNPIRRRVQLLKKKRARAPMVQKFIARLFVVTACEYLIVFFVVQNAENHRLFFFSLSFCCGNSQRIPAPRQFRSVRLCHRDSLLGYIYPVGIDIGAVFPTDFIRKSKILMPLYGGKLIDDGVFRHTEHIIVHSGKSEVKRLFFFNRHGKLAVSVFRLQPDNSSVREILQPIAVQFHTVGRQLIL